MNRGARVHAARLDTRPALWLGLLAGLAVMFAALCAHAQTNVPPEKVAPKQSVQTPAVIHPPPHIDPGMRVAPPTTQHFPTPVIKPETQHGNAVVVPK
jgi:hypothetical protein